jgi:predicted CopG family antitoxin
MHLLVYALTMKTITLDDAAYNRLKLWKKNSSESFSTVVKRLVPEAGSLGAFLAFVERRGTDRLAGNEIMQQAIENRSSNKNDPWI